VVTGVADIICIPQITIVNVSTTTDGALKQPFPLTASTCYRF